MVTVEYILMGYPIVGFFKFEHLPSGVFHEYKMHYVVKFLINGKAFYVHEN